MFFIFEVEKKNADFDASKSVWWVEWAKVAGYIYVSVCPRNAPLAFEANAKQRETAQLGL